MQLRAAHYFTIEEYLAFEQSSATKHEYYQGEVFDMAGGSLNHSAIILNIASQLLKCTRAKGCKMYAQDVRVHIPANSLFTYPDVIIVCGTPRFLNGDDYNLVNPTVLIEVLSKSTEGYDRGKKFQLYQEIPSLREYILVNQDTPRIEKWEKADTWQPATDVTNGTLLVNDCPLNVADVYEGTEAQPA